MNEEKDPILFTFYMKYYNQAITTIITKLMRLFYYFTIFDPLLEKITKLLYIMT